MYPSVNYLVKEKYFGTAYGILEAISNIGLTIGPLIIGDILDRDPLSTISSSSSISHFHQMHFFLLMLSLIGVILAIILNIYDYKD